MFLGDILVGRGLVSAADIDAALARQLTEGGRLGDNLIAMGRLTAEQLAEVMNTAPAVPASLEETGISQRSLLNLLLKFMLIEGCETLLDLAERLKLPSRGQGSPRTEPLSRPGAGMPPGLSRSGSAPAHFERAARFRGAAPRFRRAGRPGALHSQAPAGGQCRSQRVAVRTARQRQDDARDPHLDDLQGRRLYPLCCRNQRPNHQGLRSVIA